MAEFAGTPAPDVTGAEAPDRFRVLAVRRLDRSSSSLVAILAPWLPLKDPEQVVRHPGRAPALRARRRKFWFGTDQLSRDMFSRTIWGARISLTVGFAAIAFGMLVGGSLGMIAGYFRGIGDRVDLASSSSSCCRSRRSMLAILITSLLDRSLLTITITFGSLPSLPVGLVSRATTVVLRRP